MSKPKRGRPFGYPALVDLNVGDSYVVPPCEQRQAKATAKTLAKKHGVGFETTVSGEEVVLVEYKRVA